MNIEAMKQALEALEMVNPLDDYLVSKEVHSAITSLRQAIATEESSVTQEPLGYIASMAMNDLRDGIYGEVRVYQEDLDDECVAIYTHPPQSEARGLSQPKAEQEQIINNYPEKDNSKREWVGLTDDEKTELWEVSRAALPRYATYAFLIESKLKEKNVT